MGIIVNNSKGFVNHTQRNNELFPFSTCNTTSYGMFIKYNNLLKILKKLYPELEETDVQLDDFLTNFMTKDQRVIDFAAKNGYDEWNCPLNQIHACLEFGIDLLFGRDIVDFKTNMPVDEIISRLTRGESMVVNGRFPCKFKDGIIRTIGHVVCLVGYEGIGNIVKTYTDVKNFIIDDPYGNLYTAYTDTRGNDIKVSRDDFTTMFKKLNSDKVKWVHHLVS